MRIPIRVVSVMFIFLLILPCLAAAAPKKSSANTEGLKQLVDELRNNPGDKGLREKIIKITAGMKSAPAVPEEAERNMARGTAFAQKASDSAGYKRAIAEFEAALNSAPWLALAYFNLGVVQERAGLFTDAVDSLNFYLMAAPKAKNFREVKNKIYALEADAEAMQAGMNAAAEPAAAANADTEDKHLAVTGKTTLEIEPDKQLRIIKMPQDKKVKAPNYAGNWYFKDRMRGEEVVIHAFEITRSPNGDLTIVPPKRAADSVATVNIFEIADKTLKLQMKWKMKSVVGYWKTETYELVISENGSEMKGSHNQQSVGGRNIDMDRSLFRQ